MTAYLDHALRLAGDGVPVFPCKQDKTPLTPNGFHDATTDADVITEKWTRHPHALVGIPTGKASGLLVVDVDPAGADWHRDNAERLACGYTQRTRRGHHLYYGSIDGARCSAGKVAPGVDIRADGGYVIAWGAEGLEAAGSLQEVAPPPQWLREQLVPAAAPPARRNTDMGTPVHEGGRNDFLSRKAYGLRKDGLSIEAIESALQVINDDICQPPVTADEVRAIAQGKRAIAPAAETRAAIPPNTDPIVTLRHLSDIVAEKRTAQWLLRDVLEREVLALIGGDRGTFKSFIVLDWAVQAAQAGHGVVILSGEGGGLGRRAEGLKVARGVDIDALPIFALERAVPLNDFSIRDQVRAAIASLPVPVSLIVIDTKSKYSPGTDESSNTEMSLFLSGLSQSFREEFKATVLLVCHTGHGDKGRIRGAYSTGADTDAEYIVTRPDPTAMTVTVSRERFKDTPSLPPLAYTAQVVDLGRVDDAGDPATTLVLDEADEVPMARQASGTKNERTALAGLREWFRANPDARFISSDDMRELLKAQGITDRRRRPEVLNFLVNARAITASIGGYTVDPNAV